LSDLTALFTNNLLPVLLAAAAGFLLGKRFNIEPRSISQVLFYLFIPSLVFTLVTNSNLSDRDVLRMMGFATAVIGLVGLLAFILGSLLRLERRILMAVVLAAMFMNAGNYGLSVNLFAFGEDALAHATIFFITSGVLTYTVGVIIASMGSSSFKNSLLAPGKLPAIYALVFAFIFLRLGWQLPIPLARTVGLFSDATIPSMLVLLGLQLTRVTWIGDGRALVLATGLRLVAAPLVAIVLSQPFGLLGPARQAGILEAGMPSAVLITVLATEYDLMPSFVTSVVVLSTLLSPLTLTPLLAYLGA
jgi:malate permease and related proteins